MLGRNNAGYGAACAVREAAYSPPPIKWSRCRHYKNKPAKMADSGAVPKQIIIRETGT